VQGNVSVGGPHENDLNSCLQGSVGGGRGRKVVTRGREKKYRWPWEGRREERRGKGRGKLAIALPLTLEFHLLRSWLPWWHLETTFYSWCASDSQLGVAAKDLLREKLTQFRVGLILAFNRRGKEGHLENNVDEERGRRVLERESLFFFVFGRAIRQSQEMGDGSAKYERGWWPRMCLCRGLKKRGCRKQIAKLMFSSQRQFEH